MNGFFRTSETEHNDNDPIKNKFTDTVFRNLVIRSLKAVPGRNDSLNGRSDDDIYYSDEKYLSQIKEIMDYRKGTSESSEFDRTDETPLVENLNGIEYLTGLTKLELSGHMISGPLDLTKNTQLTYLGLAGSSITSIKMAPCPNMTYLNLNSNNITELDLTGKDKITDLYLQGCHKLDLSDKSGNVKKLDLWNKKNIVNLSFADTNVESVSVDCWRTLEKIDFTASMLKRLNTDEKIVGKADLHGFNQLKRIDLADTNITHLVVPDAYYLEHIDASVTNPSKNPTRSEERKPLEKIEFLKDGDYGYLTGIFLNNAEIDSLPFKKLWYAVSLDLSGTKFKSISLDQYSRLKHLTLDNCENLESLYISEYAPGARAYVDDISICNSPKFKEIKAGSYTALSAVYTLCLSGTSMDNLDVFGDLYRIYKLDIDGFKGDSVDLSSAKELKHLRASNSNLATVKGISDNITYVDFSKNPNMKALNLSGKSNLEAVLADNSGLDSVVLQNNPKLKEIDLKNNPFEDCSKIDLPKDLERLALSSKTPIKRTGLKAIPQNIKELELRNNGLTGVDFSSHDNLISLDIAGNNVKDINLKGMSSLQTLDLENNKLTSLDLSSNPELYYLKVGGNKLKSLDLSGTSVSIFDGVQTIEAGAGKFEGNYKVDMTELLGDAVNNLVDDGFTNGEYDPNTKVLTVPVGTDKTEFSYNISTKKLFPEVTYPGYPMPENSGKSINMKVFVKLTEDEAKTLKLIKEDYKKKIDLLKNLNEVEKTEYKKNVDDAADKEKAKAAYDDAVKKDLENKKKAGKAEIDKLDGLTKQEVDRFKGDIDEAKTTDDVDTIVDNAKAQDAKNKLDAKKREAEAQIENMKYLSTDEKADFKRQVNDSGSILAVEDVVAKAEEQNEKNRKALIAETKEKAKSEIEGFSNLSDSEKSVLVSLVYAEDTVEDIKDVVEKARKMNESHKELFELREAAKATIGKLKNLNPDEKGYFIRGVELAGNAEDINTEVDNAIARDKENAGKKLEAAKEKAKAEKEKALRDKKNEAIGKVDKLTYLTEEKKDEIKSKIEDAKSEAEVNELLNDAENADKAIKDKKAKEAADLLKSKENAKQEIENLPNLSEEEKKDAKQKVEEAKNIADVETALQNAKIKDAENKGKKEGESSSDKKHLKEAQDKAAKEIDKLLNLSDSERREAKENIASAEDEERIDEIVNNAKEANSAAELANKKKAAEAEIDKLSNLSESEKAEAKNAVKGAGSIAEVDAALEAAKIKNAENKGRDDEAKRHLANKKKAAETEIDKLENLSPERKKHFKDEVNKAETEAAVDSAVQAAKKEDADKKLEKETEILNAKKAAAKKELENLTDLTDKEVSDAKENIDKAENAAEVELALIKAGIKNEENKAAKLKAARDKAKADIDKITGLSDIEEQAFKGIVDEKDSEEEINKVVERAKETAKVNISLEEAKAKAKKDIDALEDLNQDEKDSFKKTVDLAKTREAVADALTKAQNQAKKNAKDKLDGAKTAALKEIEAMNGISQADKDKYEKEVKAAETADKVNEVLTEAQAANIKAELANKKKAAEAEIDKLSNLSKSEKSAAKNAVKDAGTIAEVEAALQNAKLKNAENKGKIEGKKEEKDESAKKQLDSKKQEAYEEIDKLKLSDKEKEAIKKAIEAAKTKEEIQKIVKDAETKAKNIKIDEAYMFGYKDDTIESDGHLTRAEFAAMIARIENNGDDIKAKGKKKFTDVNGGWYDKYIAYVSEKGIMNGYPDGTFKPDEPIKRAELVKAIAAMDKKANKKKSIFKDIAGHWAEAAINKEFANGIVTGYPDETFRPENKVTRAEAATMINKFYDRGVNAEGLKSLENPGDIKKFKDLDERHWGYYEIVEATNTHKFEKEKAGSRFEKWIKIIKDKFRR